MTDLLLTANWDLRSVKFTDVEKGLKFPNRRPIFSPLLRFQPPYPQLQLRVATTCKVQRKQHLATALLQLYLQLRVPLNQLECSPRIFLHVSYIGVCCSKEYGLKPFRSEVECVLRSGLELGMTFYFSPWKLGHLKPFSNSYADGSHPGYCRSCIRDEHANWFSGGK